MLAFYLTLSLLGAEPVIDQFRYVDAVSARTIIVLPGKKAFKQESDFRAARNARQNACGDDGGTGHEGRRDRRGRRQRRRRWDDRRVVILPNNPALSNAGAEALSQFVNGGRQADRRAICCIPRLGAALGFGNTKWVGQQAAGPVCRDAVRRRRRRRPAEIGPPGLVEHHGGRAGRAQRPRDRPLVRRRRQADRPCRPCC